MGSASASIFVVASLLLLLSPSTALSEDQRMEASTAPPSGGARVGGRRESWRLQSCSKAVAPHMPMALDGQDSSSPGILVHSVRVLGDTDHSVVLAWRVGPMNGDMRRSHGADGIIGPTEEIRARDPDGEREGRTENEEGGSTVKERGTGRGTGRRGRMGAPGSAGFSILYARLGEQQMRRLHVPPDHTRATVPGLEPYVPYVACVVTRSGIGRRWQHMPRREQCVVFSTDEAAHAASTQRFINAVVACVAGVISAPLAALLCCGAVKRRCRRMYGQRFQGTGRCGRGKGAGGEGSRNVMLEGVPV
ncbi:unnamed protein product [Lampetra planeri]